MTDEHYMNKYDALQKAMFKAREEGKMEAAESLLEAIKSLRETQQIKWAIEELEHPKTCHFCKQTIPLHPVVKERIIERLRK